MSTGTCATGDWVKSDLEYRYWYNRTVYLVRLWVSFDAKKGNRIGSTATGTVVLLELNIGIFVIILKSYRYIVLC
jgi:hypothetical protein